MSALRIETSTKSVEVSAQTSTNDADVSRPISTGSVEVSGSAPLSSNNPTQAQPQPHTVRPIALTCTARGCNRRVHIPWSHIAMTGTGNVRCPEHAKATR